MTASAKSAERSLRRFFGTQDMTQGNPMRNLLMFSIPLLIGNLAQQLYSTADSIIVGNFVGDNALAAVGASGPGHQSAAGAVYGHFHGCGHHGVPVLRRARPATRFPVPLATRWCWC